MWAAGGNTEDNKTQVCLGTSYSIPRTQTVNTKERDCNLTKKSSPSLLTANMETKWGGGEEKGELGTGGNGGKTETKAPGHLEPEHSKVALSCSALTFSTGTQFSHGFNNNPQCLTGMKILARIISFIFQIYDDYIKYLRKHKYAALHCHL